MFPVTAQQIFDILNDGNPIPALSNFLPFLDQYLGDISTAQRMGAFLAHVGVESNNFKATLEYASGEAYEGDAALGNTEPGDGPLFKGRGLIQITGRDNYTACSRAIFGNDCLLQTPSLLESPQYALASAAWFWSEKNINSICDMPEDWIKSGPHGYSKFEWITILINGGLNDYAQRLAYYDNARAEFNF